MLQTAYKYISKYIKLTDTIKLLFIGFNKSFLALFMLSFLSSILAKIYASLVYLLFLYIYTPL